MLISSIISLGSIPGGGQDKLAGKADPMGRRLWVSEIRAAPKTEILGPMIRLPMKSPIWELGSLLSLIVMVCVKHNTDPDLISLSLVDGCYARLLTRETFVSLVLIDEQLR